MRRRLITLGVLNVLGCLALAQTPSKPNLSGTWKLNLAKSDFGTFPRAAEDHLLKIVHREPRINLTDVAGGRTKEWGGSTDGQQVVSRTPDGERAIEFRWEGNSLIHTASERRGGLTSTQTDKISLSADGRALEIFRRVEAGMAKGQIKLVYERQ